MKITANEAYALCSFADGSAKGAPPASWTRAWTPSKVDDDNFALVLQQTTGDVVTYALVIQGTKNKLDIFEDLDVETQVELQWVTGGQISAGTLDGMNELLVLTDSNGTSLQDFLADIPTDSQLLITGHSLGGNLASTFAPWVAGTIPAFGGPQLPVTQLPSTILAITFAAPTAGNTAFADFLNAQSNYQAHFNLNDVVPHVWATSGILNAYDIQQMFDSGPSPAPSRVWTLVQDKLDAISASGLVYTQTKGKTSTYPIQQGVDWLKEMEVQHNDAYAFEFGGSGRRTS